MTYPWRILLVLNGGNTDINAIAISLKETWIARDLTWIPKSFGYKVFAVINQAFAS